MICSKMKNILKLSLMGILAVSLAHAHDHDKKKKGEFYISGSIGRADNLDASFSAEGFAGTRIGEATLASEGLVGDIAVGYSFKGLRIEGEVAWMPLDIQSSTYVRFDGLPLDLVNQHSQVTGEVSTRSVSLNLLYDFKLGKWRPYLGLGVGLMDVDLESTIQVFNVSVTNDDVDETTVVNAMIGVKRALDESGATSLDMGITYADVGDMTFVTDGRQLDADGLGITTFRIGIERKIGRKKRK